MPANDVLQNPSIEVLKYIPDGNGWKLAPDDTWKFCGDLGSLLGGVACRNNGSALWPEVTATTTGTQIAFTEEQLSGPKYVFDHVGGTNCVASGSSAVATVKADFDSPQNAVCEFYNRLANGKLTIIKKVNNDNGGTATVSDFTVATSAGALSFDGGVGTDPVVYTADTLTVTANTEYSLSEDDVAGYTEGSWSCSNGDGGAFDAGTVTLASGASVTCEITNDDIAPGLTIIKKVNNDNGGTATVSDFTVATSAGALSFDGGVGTDPVVYTADTLTVTANTEYSLSEDDVAGYTEGSWSCSNGDGGAFDAGTVTLASGASVTCEITNDDIAPGLTIIKKVNNDNGGTATVSDFTVATSAGALSFDGGVGTDPVVYTADTLTVTANTEYSLSEDDVAGYTEGSWSCSNGDGGAFDAGTVTLASGASVTCEITNDDIAPGLTIIKKVNNDNGGTATVSDFTVATSAGALSFDGGVGTDPVVYTADTLTVTANTEYSLSEDDVAGYTEGSWSCSNGDGGAFDAGTVTLASGASVTCEITNDDIAPGLTIIKKVNNDNGGTATVSDFTVATSAGALSFDGGVGTDPVVYTADTLTVTANTEYSLSEDDVAGYTEGSWSCSNGDGGAFDAGTVTLASGASVTCEITNDDIAPGLTIIKKVNNDNGGTATVSDFTVATSAGALSFDGGVGTDPVVYTADTLTVTANTEYSLSEDDVAGYTEGSWSCSNGDGGAFDAGTVTLASGASVTCEITNDDIAPGLTIIKKVNNDNGGTATVSDFTVATSAGALSFDGGVGTDPVVYTADTLTVTANTEYSLSEDDVAGYTEGSWSCSNGDGGAFDAGTVTLASGASVTCEITNDDEQAYLILRKTVMGGPASKTDFEPTIDTVPAGDDPVVVAWDDQIPLNPGDYVAAENMLVSDYVAGDWGGACDADGNVQHRARRGSRVHHHELLR